MSIPSPTWFERRLWPEPRWDGRIVYVLNDAETAVGRAMGVRSCQSGAEKWKNLHDKGKIDAAMTKPEGAGLSPRTLLFTLCQRGVDR